LALPPPASGAIIEKIKSPDRILALGENLVLLGPIEMLFVVVFYFVLRVMDSD
jgi:hypothetical protein